MAYRYGNREQLILLPNSIEDYVGIDDPVRVYDAFIDALNIKELGIQLNDSLVGNPSYDPRSMLKVLVYAYSYGWRSSRKIERALHHNLSFIWLAGGLKPDHKTISNFRKENKSVLKEVLKSCVRICMKLDLIAGNTLFVDGSKFRANAGKSATKSKATWEWIRRQTEARIDKLMEECDVIDEQESESILQIKKELRSKEHLKSKIDQLLQEMKSDKKVNGTDSDCDIMKGRQGSHAGYNVQIVADDQHGLIVNMDGNNAKNDLNQLNQQIGLAEDILGVNSEHVCADAGYSSVDDLKPMLDQGKTVVVPNNRQAQKKPSVIPFQKSAFTYEAKQDIYICPMGEHLNRRGYYQKTKRYEFRMKNAASCRMCKHFGTCTTSKIGRRIYRLQNEEARQELEAIYDSDLGQKIYKRRKMKVELPFGHLKRNLGVSSFLMRGVNGINAELSILGTCFNLARLITLMGGVRQLVSRLKEVRLNYA